MFACIGETITERAGVINLTAEGTMMFCAMAGFGIAHAISQGMTGTDDAGGNAMVRIVAVLGGFAGAAIIGALIALIVAVCTISLRQSQIAVGFVMTLLFSDLSSFLGTSIVRIQGRRCHRCPSLA